MSILDQKVAASRENTPKGYPFRVRKVTSGWNGFPSFVVVRKRDDGSYGRVTVHAHGSREAALSDADGLNIGSLVKPHEEDPRPYEERRAEAEHAYWADVAKSA